MAAKPTVKPRPAADPSAVEKATLIITDPVRHDGEDLAIGSTLELDPGAAEGLVAGGAAVFVSVPEDPPAPIE